MRQTPNALMRPGESYKRPESVLVVVHTVGGKILLLKRVRPRDFWQSVTGSLKWPDETPWRAAQRELLEETGIAAVRGLRDWHRRVRFPINPAWSGRFAPGVRENLEHMFSLVVPREWAVILNTREHTDYDWVDVGVAERRVWSWTNKAAIRRVAATFDPSPEPGIN